MTAAGAPGVRWRDRADWKSCAPSATPTATDQALGSGDGAATAFQLVKTYGSVYAPWTRTIAKPVAGSILVAVDGAPVTEGWSCDDTTGLVTFAAAPEVGAAITAGYEFDIPVRFDSDTLEINLSHFAAGDIPAIPLVEIRR